MAEACARIMEAEQKAGKKLITVGFMRRFDSSYREMKAILDTSENGAVRLNDQELSPRADFHEWHHYPKVDDTEVAK